MGIKRDGGTEEGLVPSWVFLSMAKVNRMFQSVLDDVWQWGLAPFQIKMNTLNTLLIGWLVFVVLVIILAKFLYKKYLSGSDDPVEQEFLRLQAEGAFDGSSLEPPKLPSKGCLSANPAVALSQVSKTPTTVPLKRPKREFDLGKATGGDPDAVKWINNLLSWFYESKEGSQVIRECWNDALNEFTVGAALEAGVLVEILEFFDQTPAPRLSNIIVDCDPSDNMTLTCDMEQILYLRVQTTRTQREVTTESEYACVVSPLRGRLNISVETKICAAFVKFDGWPDVPMKFEGIRNNSTGMDEEQLQEVINEVLTAALRKVNLNLNFLPHKNFPRFSRARSLPDQVIPVGYDSLVREAQTHPPSFSPKIPTSRTPLPSVAAPDINQVRSAMGIPTKAPKEEPIVPMPPPLNVNYNISGNSKDYIRPPVSQFTSPYKTSFNSEDEQLEEAGESFSAISYTSLTDYNTEEDARLAQVYNNLPSSGNRGLLTESEESLVARNMKQYMQNPSFDGHVDLSKTIYEYSEEDTETDIEYIKGPFQPNSSSYLEQDEEIPKEPVSSMKLSTEKNSPSDSGFVFSYRDQQSVDEPITNTSYTEEDEEDLVYLEDPETLKETLKNMSTSGIHSPASSSSPRDSIRDEMDFLKESIHSGTSFMNSQTNYSSPVGIVGLNGKRLLVKIVKASGIGGGAGVDSSYTVIEMDDPPQRFTTNIVSGSESTSPFWDEQFLFDLSENTLELLFEIYDRTDNRFLGLVIVGIEELVATPSQRQIIPLQARPYENDQVSGSLTCEFLYLDRADLPDIALRGGSGGGVNLNNSKFKTTTTTYVKPFESEVSEEGSTGVAAIALKDLEERHSNEQVPSTKSTMIIHASRKGELTDHSDDYTELTNGLLQQMDDPRYEAASMSPPINRGSIRPSPSASHSELTRSSSSKGILNQNVPLNSNYSSSHTPTHIDASFQTVPENEERSRSRSRGGKRDFFGSIRRRFSRSKNRSKSVEPTNATASCSQMTPVDRDPLAGRSVSMERSTARSRGLLSVPLGRIRSSALGDEGSTRSSLSGTSGFSSASTKTYINEASLLVVESLENGIIKHYLVPLPLQRKNKWRKKGTKLHIYNEHTFVAKHMSSSVTCEVCNKSLSRRLGKQGYECRDCSFKCHKPCHVKVDSVCPNSTVNSMDIVYVKDERAERKKLMKSS